MSEVFTESWTTRWLAAVSSDHELAHIGKLSRLMLHLTAGERILTAYYDQGVFSVDYILPDKAVDLLEINGTFAAWNQLFITTPAPLFNDILAMDKNHPDFSIVSDRIYLLRHLRVVLKLFSLAPRQD
jgi:hypothetical protein